MEGTLVIQTLRQEDTGFDLGLTNQLLDSKDKATWPKLPSSAACWSWNMVPFFYYIITTKAWHCERPGKAICEGAASDAVDGLGLKGSCKEIEAWHNEERLLEAIGASPSFCFPTV